MHHLTIYSTLPDAPRLRYPLEVLFGTLLACDFQLTADRELYQATDGPRINYSRQRLSSGELFIPAGPLLFEKGVDPRARPLEVATVADLPAFFFLEAPTADLPFDLFALIFFLLSRYEEYLPFAADEHGRFPATASLAFRHNFLDRPLVEEWAGRLAERIGSRFPGWTVRPSAYRFLPTYDIDLAWAYRHRGLARTLLALPRSPRKRLEVLLGRREDPFAAAFHWLDELHERWPTDPVFFFLLASFGRYDRGIHYRKRALQRLIEDLAGRYRLGIHPSYRSSRDDRRLPREIGRLAAILQEPVSRSRQHYLRLRLPATYRGLLQNGIRADFTMGFADAIGFRAGTATPFPWYDLKREQATPLAIWPFQVMDVSLKNYLQLSPGEALPAVLPLIRRCRQVGGTFITLWHNSSLADEGEWAGWRETYRQIYTAAYQAPDPQY